MRTAKPLHPPISLALIFFILILGCVENKKPIDTEKSVNDVNPAAWPSTEKLPLDPAIEAQIDDLLPKLTLEQKDLQEVCNLFSDDITLWTEKYM